MKRPRVHIFRFGVVNPSSGIVERPWELWVDNEPKGLYRTKREAQRAAADCRAMAKQLRK